VNLRRNLAPILAIIGIGSVFCWWVPVLTSGAQLPTAHALELIQIISGPVAVALISLAFFTRFHAAVENALALGDGFRPRPRSYRGASMRAVHATGREPLVGLGVRPALEPAVIPGAPLRIDQVSKGYGPVTAVKDVNLEIAAGEFVALVGPSGGGKTTLLRLLAGFLVPDTGRILRGDTVLSSPGHTVPPEGRGMGMVFQSYALWPHMTVYQNIVFGLEVRRVGREAARARVKMVLEQVRLSGLEARYPDELSGGQQQRVALARSLVVEPAILLLDEPLSNLDARLREEMRWELKALQRETSITFVYVTHDQAEAMALADRIAVLQRGTLVQCGSPREVYCHPASRAVADFMGLINLLPGRVLRVAGPASVVAVAGPHQVPVTLPSGIVEGQTVQVAVRPESLRVSPAPAEAHDGATGVLPGTVAEVTFLGNLTDCQVALEDGTRVRWQAGAGDAIAVGQRVHLLLDPGSTSVFPS
jgi:iron(III) transport system ATP-binding protein